MPRTMPLWLERLFAALMMGALFVLLLVAVSLPEPLVRGSFALFMAAGAGLSGVLLLVRSVTVEVDPARRAGARSMLVLGALFCLGLAGGFAWAGAAFLCEWRGGPQWVSIGFNLLACQR